MKILESRKSQRGHGRDKEVFILAIKTGRRRCASVPVGWGLNWFTLLTYVSPAEWVGCRKPRE